MTDSSITLREASGDDLNRVESLLAANGLPSEDVRAKPGSFFVALSGEDVVGAGGVEVHGTDGLLRSLVIVEHARGRGYGKTVCERLEEYARERGVERLYLLTTTAAAFFRARGYEEVPRDEAPPAIRGTTEFTDLCPDSATCLTKRLG